MHPYFKYTTKELGTDENENNKKEIFLEVIYHIDN